MAGDPASYSLGPESKNQGLKSGLTVRSAAIGLLFVGFLCLCSIHSSWVLHSTSLATNYFPSGFVFPMLLFIVVLNPVLKLLNRRRGLSEQELAVVAIMGLVACAVPTYGMVGYLFSTTAAPYYFASPENRWAETFHQYLPTWLLPTDFQSIKWFFEGLPEPSIAIPWRAWATPLFWWLLLILAFTGACLCLLAMFRKQWMERERLTYPLAEISLMMIEDCGDRKLVPKMMRSKLFWCGFGLVSLIMSWNFVGYFVPVLPPIKWTLPYVSFGQSFPGIPVYASPLVISISFFLRLDVSFSVWFFYLLQNIQTGVFTKLGIPFGEFSAVYDLSPPGIAWQCFGGFIVIVATGMWLGRSHFVHIFRKTFGMRSDEDDSEEVLPYRAALLGFIALSLLMAILLWRAGLSPLASALFVGATFLTLIGLTRIVIDAGLVFVRPPLTTQSFVAGAMGTRGMTPETITTLGLTNTIYCDPIAHFMPLAANALRIGYQSRVTGRSMLTAIVLSFLFALLLSVPATMHIAYERGAYNFREWQFGGHAYHTYKPAAFLMNNSFGPDRLKMTYMAGGMLLTAGLLLLRYRYTWFPINPIGFPVAMVFQVTRTVTSIFIGWLIKLLILKLGGARIYEKAKPFFLGAIIAFLSAAVISYVLDALFFAGGPPHGVYM